MAITEVKPKDQNELKQKVWERKPGEEASLIREVRSQVSNKTIYNNAEDSFLIGGSLSGLLLDPGEPAARGC